MTKIKDITRHLETIAPKAYQESYDNAGLITGDPSQECTGILVSLDCIESVVDEAIEKNCNMIVAHHPIVFKGIKQLNGKNYVEKTVIKAIKNDIAIYAIHTNLDNVDEGVNRKLAEVIGLQDLKILSPKKHVFQKLITFIPSKNTTEVLDAMHKAGAGHIGDYEKCSFRVTGKGRFKPSEEANPQSGEVNEINEVDEDRVELIYPSHLASSILSTLNEAHPYEEVAHFIHTIENHNSLVGSGMVGTLPSSLSGADFLDHLKERLNLKIVRHTALGVRPIKTVAVCGGAGSFLLGKAIQAKADAFVTSDFKYHEFFDAEGKTVICDVGHYESEIFTKDLLHSFLTRKIS